MTKKNFIHTNIWHIFIIHWPKRAKQFHIPSHVKITMHTSIPINFYNFIIVMVNSKMEKDSRNFFCNFTLFKSRVFNCSNIKCRLMPSFLLTYFANFYQLQFDFSNHLFHFLSYHVLRIKPLTKIFQ